MPRPKKADPIRDLVLNGVQHVLLLSYVKPKLPQQPGNVEDIEVTAISPSQTQVKVKFYEGDPRIFIVKVSERNANA